MKKSEEALKLFRNPYSCAQAVALAFGELSQEELDHLKENSGGRAKNNMCGALYSACKILNNEELATKKFLEKIGSCSCKEIKLKHKTACDDCVRVATDIVEEEIK